MWNAGGTDYHETSSGGVSDRDGMDLSSIKSTTRSQDGKAANNTLEKNLSNSNYCWGAASLRSRPKLIIAPTGSPAPGTHIVERSTSIQ
jgi:hypothetical protein